MTILFTGGYCFGAMNGLSNKQLKAFVGSESVCYEKVIEGCNQSEELKLVLNMDKKDKKQIDNYAEKLDHLKVASEISPTDLYDYDSPIFRPPETVFFIESSIRILK